ncbi:MAG: glucose 1-dehydrogenase [Actinomycetales bacterium]|nr:glucose 1-dehydrogenase [Actinomycetales bacterium]
MRVRASPAPRSTSTAAPRPTSRHVRPSRSTAVSPQGKALPVSHLGNLDQWFEDRSAIVTGGAGGMGRATALAFAAAGSKVTVADVAEEGGRETVALIEAAGGTAQFVRADVSQDADVKAMVEAAVNAHGGLDFAVNAAAIEFEVDYLADLAESDWDRMIAVNLKSVFLSMKHEINAMLVTGREGAAIVNIASTNSYRPQPHQSAYTASKFGVLGVTKSAAVDYGPRGIRINAICPGSIDTPMLRGAIEKRGRDPQEVADRLSLIGRFGTVDEIAAAALWLCSGASSFTMGHALAVDGGYLAR